MTNSKLIKIVERIKTDELKSIEELPSSNKMYNAGELHAAETFNPEVGPREFNQHDDYTDGYYASWMIMDEIYRENILEEVRNG